MLLNTVVHTHHLYLQLIPQQELVSQMGPYREQNSREMGPRTGKSLGEGLNMGHDTHGQVSGGCWCLGKEWSWGVVSNRKDSQHTLNLASRFHFESVLIASEGSGGDQQPLGFKG